VIIRPLNRVNAGAAVPDGGSDAMVITAQRREPVPLQPARGEPARGEPAKGGPVTIEPVQFEPVQLELSSRMGPDGYQVISVTGELDIATADKAYAYISEVIDSWQVPVTVDLSGLTFCDASGLGVLAKVARHARQAGRQLKLTSARPPLLKIMRMTGLDGVFPELRPSAPVYSALPAALPRSDRSAVTVEDTARWR
jgi:anti-sigma B factor antagonist